MINERLKKIRKERKKAQSEIAKVLNCAQTTYSKYEIGKARPSVNTLKSLAKYYNIDINYFLYDEENQAPEQTNNNIVELTQTIMQLTDTETLRVKAYIQGILDNRPNTTE